MFTGTYTALVTPFNGRRQRGLRQAAGAGRRCRPRPASTASCRSGTTGESPTLDYDEHNRVIEVAVEAAAAG